MSAEVAARPPDRTAEAYDALSGLYGHVWGETFCPLFVDVVAREVLRHVEPGSSLLDLGCGTGQLAERAVREGFRVTGLDISAGMVSAARACVPAGRFVVGDLAEYDLGERFDVIVSTLDCFNHCLTLERLLQAFRTAHDHLAEDGVFFFDMNGRGAFQPAWTRTMDLADPERFVAISCALGEDDIATYRVAMFAREGANWRRRDAAVRQRAYEPDEVLDLLRRAGFRAGAHDAALDFNIPNLPGRTFYFAEREG